MGVAHHLKTIGGISNVSTSYWFEKFHLVYLLKALKNSNLHSDSLKWTGRTILKI